MELGLNISHPFSSLILFSKQKLHGSRVVDYSLAWTGIKPPQHDNNAKMTSTNIWNA